MLAQRLRQRAKRGAQISVVHSADDDLLIKVFAKAITIPSLLPSLLAQILKACAELKSVSVDAELAAVHVSDDARKIAGSLVSGRKVGILLGNFAQTT